MNNITILFVEDDQVISTGLTYSLKQEGYTVLYCPNFREAVNTIENKPFDMALLDLSLPDGSGYELCKLIKKKGDLPVIFLTALDDEVNVVMGLDMGADDYISKPFRIRELLSRIKSVLRRCKGGEQHNVILELGDIRINTAQAKVFKSDNELVLTALEYRLLLILAGNRGQVISRNKLLDGLWDYAGEFVNDNTLTVYIKRLREKIEDDPGNPKLIKTVRGLGYKAGE